MGRGCQKARRLGTPSIGHDPHPHPTEHGAVIRSSTRPIWVRAAVSAGVRCALQKRTWVREGTCAQRRLRSPYTSAPRWWPDRAGDSCRRAAVLSAARSRPGEPFESASPEGARARSPGSFQAPRGLWHNAPHARGGRVDSPANGSRTALIGTPTITSSGRALCGRSRRARSGGLRRWVQRRGRRGDDGRR